MTVATLLMMVSMATSDRVAGFLTGRAYEVGEILIGVVGLLAVLTLRHDIASLNAIEQALAMSHTTHPEHHPHQRVSSL